MNPFSLLLTFLPLVFIGSATGQNRDVGKQFASFVGPGGLSEPLDVFAVDSEKQLLIGEERHTIGAGFQPSVVMDHEGTIHVFFQARLGGSGDRLPKLIAHVTSRDGGASWSEPRFVNTVPMQTYAMSAFLRTTPEGTKRISVLTSLSIDETIERLEDPELIQRRLGIDVTKFSRRAATLVLEFYSDDQGETWQRKEHFGLSDRVYQRNGRDYYLAFINLIGQVRRVETGPYEGRLLLGGPLRGDYLPCADHPHFRDYPPSSSIIYSDDDGQSWEFGGVINDESAFQHNEASAVAVNDGQQVLLVRRNNSRDATGKMTHLSHDGGETWEDGYVSNIAATRCLQVLETHGEWVLCSAPGTRDRTHGTIYFSRDGGKNWTPKVIEEGPFSYSTVNRLSGDYLICCYSRAHHGEQGIAARIFSVKWLENE
ncbi:MAG: exo-alpha-sialidase [Pirellulaceae bacterium]